MNGLKYFEDTALELNNPAIRAWKEAEKSIIGLTCSNIPEELLHAAGLLPIRLRAPNIRETDRADSHLYRINCTYTRSVLEYLLRGEYDFLDGFVITNTCDHHLRLAGELEDKHHFPFIHYFQMYHSLTEGAREWLILEMEKLIQRVENTYSLKITERDLRHSISVYNQTRRLMAQLNELRKKDPPPISGTEYMQIALTGMSTPREQFNDRLEELLPELEARQTERTSLPRLLIIGGACDSPGFIDFIEDKGACFVADGLCFGLRHYRGIIDENAKDPISAIADRYLDRVPCPSIIDGFDHGYGILRKIIKDWGIQGVISARLKFCDHWAGNHKMLRDALLKDNTIPILNIEREYSTIESGQISTRVQAFLEMIRR